MTVSASPTLSPLLRQRDLVSNAIDVARSYTPVLEMCAGLIAELDAYNRYRLRLSRTSVFSARAVVA